MRPSTTWRWASCCTWLIVGNELLLSAPNVDFNRCACDGGLTGYGLPWASINAEVSPVESRYSYLERASLAIRMTRRGFISQSMVRCRLARKIKISSAPVTIVPIPLNRNRLDLYV